MSLNAVLALKNEAGANRSFTTTQVGPTGVTRLDDGTTLSTPTMLKIQHSTAGKGDDLSDRHLLQATRVELDANGIPFTTVVNLTISVPRKSASMASAYDLVSFLKDLVDTAGAHATELTQILQGQS